MNSIGKSDTIICVEWFTQCNLKCEFCYNFLSNTMTDNKQGNFDLLPYMNNIEGDKVFLEAGGELLLAPYFVELMQQKQDIIKNYKGLIYSNGEIPSTKFKNIVEEVRERNINMDIVISPHLEQNLQYVEDNLVHYYNSFGRVNMNLLVVRDPEIYLDFLKRVNELPIDNVHINISFDYKIFDVFNDGTKINQLKAFAFIKSYKEVYDYIRDNFIFLNYERGFIADKYAEIIQIFDTFFKDELTLTAYNPSISFFIDGDNTEIHVENRVVTLPINELQNFTETVDVDNSDVSPSEVLTFHVCNF